MDFTLGETLLLYEALSKLPQSTVLHAGEFKSGAKHDGSTVEDLKIKIIKLGNELENKQLKYHE